MTSRRKDNPPLGTASVRLSDPRAGSKSVSAPLTPWGSNMKRSTIKIGSLNVGSMTSRSYELKNLMRRRKIDIMCLQEVGWCNSQSSLLEH